MSPEVGQEPGLVAVVSAANGAAEEHESAVILTRAEYLPRMPGQRRSIERDQHEFGLGARDKQCGIVQSEPRAALPRGDMDDGELFDQPPAGSDEPMGGVLVSQQPIPCRLLLRASDGLPRGTL